MADEKFVSKDNATLMAQNFNRRFANRAMKADLEGKQDKLSLPLSVENGGTGANDAAGARSNLGAASAADLASKADASALSDKADKSAVTKDALISTIGVFGGATSTQAGTIGLVPAPPAGTATALTSEGWKVGSVGSGSSDGMWFGTTSNQANNNIFTVTLTNSDGFALKEGVIVCIKFTQGKGSGNSGQSINVNGTGNYPIPDNLTNPRSTSQRFDFSVGVGGAALFVFSGNSWIPLAPYITTVSGGGSPT